MVDIIPFSCFTFKFPAIIHLFIDGMRVPGTRHVRSSRRRIVPPLYPQWPLLDQPMAMVTSQSCSYLLWYGSCYVSRTVCWLTHYFLYYLFPPIYDCLRPSFSSSPVATQTRGHTADASPPSPPRYAAVRASLFYRDNASALSSLDDWHRIELNWIAPTYPRHF